MTEDNMPNYRFVQTYKDFRIYGREIGSGFFYKAVNEEHKKTIAVEGNLELVLAKIDFWEALDKCWGL